MVKTQMSKHDQNRAITVENQTALGFANDDQNILLLMGNQYGRDYQELASLVEDTEPPKKNQDLDS